MKYNRPEGAVAVDFAAAGSHSIRLSVRDTGVGLTPEQLAQLFQPFNRLGKEGGPEEGTGIGLVVTKRLVELMGGNIGAASIPGAGSVFWVEFPVAAAPLLALMEAAQAATLAPVALDGRPLRTVQYVEDNQANLEVVAQLIARRQDLRLLTAGNGHLGVEYARACVPDVILMDINLPGLSGTAAMQLLRTDPATTHIPVIALSANAVPRDIEQGLAAGFFNYITKPIVVSRFMDALDVALLFAERDADERARAGALA